MLLFERACCPYFAITDMKKVYATYDIKEELLGNVSL